MYHPGIIMLLLIAFMLGRACEKWASGTMDIEDAAYQAGYDEGFADGQREEGIRLQWLGIRRHYRL